MLVRVPSLSPLLVTLSYQEELILLLDVLSMLGNISMTKLKLQSMHSSFFDAIASLVSHSSFFDAIASLVSVVSISK